jgi:hypothetical protein
MKNGVLLGVPPLEEDKVKTKLDISSEGKTPLTFAILKDHGMVYLRGTGCVRWGEQEVALPIIAEGKKPAPTSKKEPGAPLELVAAATLYKMLMIDLSDNLMGMGWEDRDREGWGLKVLTKAMATLRKEYEFEHPAKNEDFELDMPTPMSGWGGAGSGGEPEISMTVPDEWFELFSFKNWGKLPIVKYRSGAIYVALKSLTVSFTDGMRILINGKEYTYKGSALVPVAKPSR